MNLNKYRFCDFKFGERREDEVANIPFDISFTKLISDTLNPFDNLIFSSTIFYDYIVIYIIIL